MRSIGIDLGTTNSVLAVNTEVRDVEGHMRAGLMPSVVAFPPSGGVLVGEAARQRRVIDPAHTLFSFKRLMGAPWHGSARARFEEAYPHALVRAADGAVLFDTRAGHISPTALSATVLGHLVRWAGLSAAEHRVVVTVPSAFGEAARGATREAALQAGFGDVRLIEEPVAIACAYLQRSSLRYAVVYDLGGGTFDCAVVDCEKYPFEVLGHAGDPYLGGDDLDLALARRVAADVLRETGWDLCTERTTFGALVGACEAAKVELSTASSAVLALDEIDPASPPQIARYTVQRELLAALARPLIQRTFQLADEVLHRVSLRSRDIQAVFLAGGSTRLPGLHEAVTEYFGRRPRQDMNPAHVVAIGASAVGARPNLWPLLA